MHLMHPMHTQQPVSLTMFSYIHNFNGLTVLIPEFTYGTYPVLHLA